MRIRGLNNEQKYDNRQLPARLRRRRSSNGVQHRAHLDFDDGGSIIDTEYGIAYVEAIAIPIPHAAIQKKMSAYKSDQRCTF